jgi:biopolymer transport protein ExbD
MKLPPDTSETEGPNLTPVIDVVFLLLIFFLVATQYQDDHEERRLDQIKLPTAALAQPASMTPKLVINITSDGKFVIEEQEYSAEELEQVLAEANRNNPSQMALIYGDENSALKHAVKATGLCNKIGMESEIAVLQRREAS